MANVLAEIAKKLQASGKRYTPRDLDAIARLVGYLGEDGETEMSDKKFRILNQSIADNEAYRDMYMTMSPDEQLEVAAPFIADEMAKDYENRGIKLAVEDPDAWMANERENAMKICERFWKGHPKKLKECLDERELADLEYMERLQNEAETWKKNIAEFRVTPEDVMLDPLQYTESFRPDIRKLANKLLTGED